MPDSSTRPDVWGHPGTHTRKTDEEWNEQLKGRNARPGGIVGLGHNPASIFL